MANRVIYVGSVLPNQDIPTGGIRVIYRHVELLTKHGYDAVVWNLHKASYGWFSSTAPTVHGDTIELDPSDVLVIPQEYTYFGIDDPAPGCKKVNFSQSIFSLGPGVQAGINPRRYENWDPSPSIWVISGMALEIMLRLKWYSYARSISLIPQAINTELFKPAPEKQRKVSWMPRKRPGEAELLHELLCADQRFNDVVLSPIDKMSERETATELGASSIFIAITGPSEGFGLPSAEALSAGCAVVGYPAGGGKEIFECPGAFAVPDSDLPALIDQVADLVMSPPTEKDRNGYRQWIKERYNEECQLRGLADSIETVRDQPARGGCATHPGAMSRQSGGPPYGELIEEIVNGKNRELEVLR